MYERSRQHAMETNAFPEDTESFLTRSYARQSLKCKGKC